MQKNIKRILSLVLVVVLCLSAMPLSAFATDEVHDGTYEVAEAEETPAVDPDEEGAAHDENAEESTGEPEVIPEETDPYEAEGMEIEAVKVWPTPMRRAAMAASVGASSVLKIGNYCFANEVGLLPALNLVVHNLPAKTMLSGGTHIAAYCLDAHLGATDGTGYTWSDLSKNNQDTIAAILALGFQWNSSSVWSGPSDNADKWAVTQILVWEAAANNIFLQANGLYGVKSSVDADINKAAACAYNPSGFKSYYEGIKKKLNDFMKIPSFASKESSNAETITLRWDGSKYSATVTDSNAVLNKFDFWNCIPGVKASASGNSLTLSTTEPILNPKTSSKVDNNDRLAGGKGAVAVWQTSDSSQQDFATYNADGGEPVGCYIKVKTDAVGNAGIVKTAEDGKVSGLQFQITGSDGSSTTKTTDANGNIDIDGLPIYTADGSKITYTATEVNVPSKYVKPESQTFQLSDGETASLQFDNKLKRWRVTVTKVDSATGSTAQGNGSLAGAKYGVYKGNELVKEYTTDSNGQFTTDYFPYGEDWTLREITASEGYKVSSTATKLCEIPAGTNDEYNDNAARVTEDIMRGGVSVEKRDSQTGTTPQGDASFAGIVFEIINNSANPVEVDGKVVSPGKAAKEITTN
ncbi:thioester domain-containing protein, partial [Acutalibacter muris]